MYAAATTTPAFHRGTVKKLRAAPGLDLTKPVWYHEDSNGKRYGTGKGFDSVSSDRGGAWGYREGERREWLGGVASVFWLRQFTDADVDMDGEDVEGERRIAAAEAAAAAEVAPAAAAPAAPAAAAEGDELDGLKFAELMEIAKALKVPGRGTARAGALREGIRTARAAQG